MNITTLLEKTHSVFLDTAPIIYFVEKHPRYFKVVRPIFEWIDAGDLETVTSPITLAECLVHPHRMGDQDAVKTFRELLTHHMRFVRIDDSIAARSAELRARYNLGLPDALQCAVALYAGCDAFLTNDIALKRVMVLNVITLNDMLDM